MLAEEHSASPQTQKDARDALSYYNDVRRYGAEAAKPHGGGMNNQPYLWKKALDCIYQAKEDAESEKAELRTQHEAGIRDVGIDELAGGGGFPGDPYGG